MSHEAHTDPKLVSIDILEGETPIQVETTLSYILSQGYPLL